MSISKIKVVAINRKNLFVLLVFVITSYSIHYTKLYEVERSRSAVVAVGVPTAFQVVPPSIEYCHVPFDGSVPVIAMPSTAPVSTSVIELPTIDATVCPAFATSSSVIPVSVGDTAVRTGARITSYNVCYTKLLRSAAVNV